jgi:tripartite-type tricarboxylate transporter receptor subunit TctC
MSSGKERSPVLPDVQSAIEAGYPQLLGETWYGLFAPLGTPKPIVDAVSAAVREAIRDETVLKSFATLGAAPIGNTPEQFAQLVREEAERLEALVKRFPIQ